MSSSILWVGELLKATDERITEQRTQKKGLQNKGLKKKITEIMYSRSCNEYV
jgi:hypothetical protein